LFATVPSELFNEMIRNFVASTSAPSIGRPEVLDTRDKLNKSVEKQEENGQGSEQNNKKTKTSGRYKPFKSTALVLRDVKNSIELVS
jgi:hypothetical protein